MSDSPPSAPADLAARSDTTHPLRVDAYHALTGLAMGAADVVPGVSGGTMAFIMGVYEDLIGGIRSFDLDLARDLFAGRLRSVATRVPWRFLIVLGAGILTSLLTLAHLVSWLLEHRQTELYAFFFGLVVASIVAVAADLRWTPWRAAALAAGAAGAWAIVGMVPQEAPNTPIILFLSGIVAISAMILPGISGSFLLLILGQYAFVLASLKALDVVAILPLALGCAVGLPLMARGLGWLFARAHDLTIALLVGFMLGSLRKIWPFKEVTPSPADDKLASVVERNVLPALGDATTWIALALALVGFAVIFGLDRLRRRLLDDRDARGPGRPSHALH
ncbi:MAG: DUF368 domain-containing protein [Acidobacteriota bacterium]